MGRSKGKEVLWLFQRINAKCAALKCGIAVLDDRVLCEVRAYGTSYIFSNGMLDVKSFFFFRAKIKVGFGVCMDSESQANLFSCVIQGTLWIDKRQRWPENGYKGR